jgi:hypothetical protein
VTRKDAKLLIYWNCWFRAFTGRLVELRGFETLTSVAQASARLTAGAARCGSAGPSAEDAPLDLALDRRRFTCPAQRQRLEGLAEKHYR